MKNFSFLILALAFFIALPSYSNPTFEKNSFIKMRKRFQKIDKNGDGLLSKDEMIEAHRNRIDKIFLKFDKEGDSKLSKKVKKIFLSYSLNVIIKYNYNQ